MDCDNLVDELHARWAADVRQLLDHLLAADRGAASGLVKRKLDGGATLEEIYLGLFQPALYEIGRRWEHNEITVAEEHYCTAAIQMCMSELYPLLFAAPRCGRTLVAASVSGELHEVGVRMVCDLFEANGWSTYYVGANLPADSFVPTFEQHEPELIGFSCTLLQHLGQVRRMVEAVRTSAALASARIIVGGQPFNRDPDLWRDVGADGCASDAGQAVRMAEQWLATPRKAG